MVAVSVLMLGAYTVVTAQDSPSTGDSVAIESPLPDELTIDILEDQGKYDHTFECHYLRTILVRVDTLNILVGPGSTKLDTMGITPDDLDFVIITDLRPPVTATIMTASLMNTRSKVVVAEPPRRRKTEDPKKGKDRIRWVTESRKLADHVYVVGPTAPGSGAIGLCIETSRGIVVIAGCGYSDMARTAQQARSYLNRDPFLVIGGYRDIELGDNFERGRVAETLQRMGTQYVATTQCTGQDCRNVLRESFGDHYLDLSEGDAIRLSELE